MREKLPEKLTGNIVMMGAICLLFADMMCVRINYKTNRWLASRVELLSHCIRVALPFEISKYIANMCDVFFLLDIIINSIYRDFTHQTHKSAA